MPSLEEIREWLRGKPVKGLPDRKRNWDFPKKVDGTRTTKKKKGRKGVDIGKMEKATDAVRKFGEAARKAGSVLGGKYRISADGEDAVLLFGKHKGKEVSRIATEAPSYLEWMLTHESPKDLLDIVEYQLEKLKEDVFEDEEVEGETSSGTKFKFRASGLPPRHPACRSELILEDDIDKPRCLCGFEPGEHTKEYEFEIAPTKKEFNKKLRDVHGEYHRPWARKGKSLKERTKRSIVGTEFEKKMGWR